MKCPACQSANIRRSRHRPEDSGWRLAFFKSYRCRDCKHRFRQANLAPALAVLVVAGLALSAAFGLGFVAVGQFVGSSQESPAAASGLVTPSDRAGSATGGPPAAVADNAALIAEAENGNAKAQFRLAMIFLRGEGVEPDFALARKWLEKSASQGYAAAQYTLGNLHYTGRGALQSYPLALKWFERAAQQDHAEAQYQLGFMYRVGQGAEVDKPKAYFWFTLAAAQGHRRARESLDNLLPALTPEQIKLAQREAQEWKPVAAIQ